jgi:hypothetical protein
MIRILLVLSLLACACPASHPAPPAHPPAPAAQSFLDEARAADVLFVGRLTAIGPSPGFWSGRAVALQRLTYEVEEGLHAAPQGQVEVVFVIVGGAPYVTGQAAEVRPELRRLGERYLIAESAAPDLGLVADDVVVATPEILAAVRSQQ